MIARSMFSKASLVAAVTLSIVAGIYAGRSAAFGQVRTAETKDRRVHELMDRVHHGRRSPWKQLESLADQDKPTWDQIAKLMPRFNDMSKALADSPQKAVADASTKYVAAVKDLAAASDKQDAAALKDAVKSLKNSCADCHSQGGPGGRLKD